MSDNIFKLLNEWTKEGLLTNDEKKSVKEMMTDNNGIVLDMIEDYKDDHDKAKFIEKIKDYIKLINEDESDRNYVGGLASPEGENLFKIKKNRDTKKKKPEEEEDNFANLEECEEGLSPKVIFEKKK